MTRFEFVTAPWMNDQGILPQYQSPNKNTVRKALGRFASRYNCDQFLEVRETSSGLYSVVDGSTGADYVPVFTVTLELTQVEALALSLANFLAHGSLPSWNGEALVELLTE